MQLHENDRSGSNASATAARTWLQGCAQQYQRGARSERDVPMPEPSGRSAAREGVLYQTGGVRTEKIGCVFNVNTSILFASPLLTVRLIEIN